MIEKAAVGWLGAAAGVAVWQGLTTVYAEFLGLYGIAGVLAAVATILTSLVAIGAVLRRAVRRLRVWGRMGTTILGLDQKLDEHRDESREQWKRTERRLGEGADRMDRIEGVLDAWASMERAAVSGAIEALTAPHPPRSARATDPEVRTGWRE